MTDLLRRALVQPLALHWLANSCSSWRSLASPESSGLVSVLGPDPDRILLVGGGISVGWGMSSHDDALGGYIARSVSAATGRGVAMDVITDDILSGSAKLPSGVTRILRTADAVVITPGDIDAILFLPAAIYRRQLENTLDQMTRAGPANMRIFIVGTLPLLAAIALPRAFRPWAAGLGAALNGTARQLCQEMTNTIFVPFSPSGIAGRERTGRTYAAWAGLIAPPIARQLDSCTDRSIR